MLTQPVVVVNTHPGDNPQFVDQLSRRLAGFGPPVQVISGYDGTDPLQVNPQRIVLSAVPIDADYSLSRGDTRRRIEANFGWLRRCSCPVLGICFGHQIINHIFGGRVEEVGHVIFDRHYRLSLEKTPPVGIFAGVHELEVFAEHGQWVVRVAPGFRVLCRRNTIPYVVYHAQREIYGLQFVPEYSGEATLAILSRFVSG